MVVSPTQPYGCIDTFLSLEGPEKLTTTYEVHSEMENST
jgi:hypothetical protein